MIVYLLKEIREKEHMSAVTLSAISGISTTYISEIETGRANPTIKIMCRLAEAMRVPVGCLLYCKPDSQ